MGYQNIVLSPPKCAKSQRIVAVTPQECYFDAMSRESGSGQTENSVSVTAASTCVNLRRSSNMLLTLPLANTALSSRVSALGAIGHR
jgi:hypothetical protein